MEAAHRCWAIPAPTTKRPANRRSGSNSHIQTTERDYAMANLVLHCGARHVERREVEEAATPAASPTWVPIAHHRLLDQIESTLVASDMKVVNEAHALWSNGLRYFGL